MLTVGFVGRNPLLGLWYTVAAGADPFVERYCLTGSQQLLQFGLIPRYRRVVIYLEYRQWKDSEITGAMMMIELCQ